MSIHFSNALRILKNCLLNKKQIKEIVKKSEIFVQMLGQNIPCVNTSVGLFEQLTQHSRLLKK